jgi:hypothetical protein
MGLDRGDLARHVIMRARSMGSACTQRGVEGSALNADDHNMRDAFLVLVLLGGVALLVLAMVRVTSRRRAELEEFTAERPLTPELRATLMAEAQTRTFGSAPAGPDATGDGTGAPPTGDPAPPAAPVAPLVDLLAGMDLPCELSYLGTVEPEPGVREVLAFSTVDHLPEDVDVAMAAELARLGYEVVGTDVGSTRRATRDGVLLVIEVHAEPATVLRGRKPAFPTAPPRSVVLEISRS